VSGSKKAAVDEQIREGGVAAWRGCALSVCVCVCVRVDIILLIRDMTAPVTCRMSLARATYNQIDTACRTCAYMWSG
jgi:hypothetical protein